MPPLSLIMVHIAPYFQQLWPFVYEIHRFKWCPLPRRKVMIRILWNCVKLFSTVMPFLSLIMFHMAPCFKEFKKNHRLKRHLLSNRNSFDYNSMKLGHIIKYHNVFKFQNGPYRIMSSGVIALCLWKFLIYTNLAIAGASVSHGHISSSMTTLECSYLYHFMANDLI